MKLDYYYDHNQWQVNELLSNLVFEVYRDLNLPCDPELNLFRKINSYAFMETVGPTKLTKIVTINQQIQKY